ncbi:response regulator [Ruminococcaceae bacterium OttesenSCG-928-L11]|nr:response regulator [Ruminococcaceae bacterium OttesenSCG-928-L11]
MEPYTVMLVDDEPWALVYLERITDWGAQGFSVIGTEESPAAALEKITLLRPDVVLVDINMPGMSGLELARRAKEGGAESVFVVVSGYAEFACAREGLALGLFDYLLKPVEEEIIKLLTRIREVLAGQRDEEVAPEYDGAAYANQNFSELLRYVNGHFGEKLTLKSLTDRFHLNANYGSLLFSKNLGTSFSEYLLSIRMKEARRLICFTNMPIKEIAATCGFDDYFYFNKVCKRYFGKPPATLRADR